MFPFLRGAGGKLRETIQNLFQTPFEGNHGRRFYISAKRSTNRKTTKKVDESTLTTLCAVCRGAFLDAKGVHLRRADPRQLVKDVCTYCQTRYGFDYYADMEPHIGSEQGGKRPVVVLQNNIGNRHSPTLIVATVTTRTEKKKNQPTHVLVDSNPAFEEPSMILLEQIFTIDKSRIERFMGYASKAEMLRIDMALLVSLALNVLSGNRSE